MAMVIGAGIFLLGVFSMFGRLWGHDAAGIAPGACWFVPVWAVIALVNTWLGVTGAGFAVIQEMPILVVVLAVPAARAMIVSWRFMKG